MMGAHFVFDTIVTHVLRAWAHIQRRARAQSGVVGARCVCGKANVSRRVACLHLLRNVYAIAVLFGVHWYGELAVWLTVCMRSYTLSIWYNILYTYCNPCKTMRREFLGMQQTKVRDKNELNRPTALRQCNPYRIKYNNRKNNHQYSVTQNVKLNRFVRVDNKIPHQKAQCGTQDLSSFGVCKDSVFVFFLAYFVLFSSFSSPQTTLHTTSQHSAQRQLDQNIYWHFIKVRGKFSNTFTMTLFKDIRMRCFTLAFTRHLKNMPNVIIVKLVHCT